MQSTLNSEIKTTFPRPTKTKRIINLILGMVGTVSFGPIILGAGIGTLFADCPSCDARIPLLILILAGFGMIFSIILTILSSSKDMPYRVDSLFLLPAFMLGSIMFLEITGSFSSSLNMDQYIKFALYSAGIAFVLEIGFIIWIGMKFFSKKIKNLALSTTTQRVSSTPPIPQTLPISHTITPVLESILSNDPALVRTALQDHPKELNTAYSQNGNTPLHVAALNGYTDIVRILLEQPGIDTSRTNNDGKTALDLAQAKKFTEIAQLLEK